MVEVEDWFFWVNILNFESYSMLWFAQKSGDLLWENVSFFEGWENVSLTTFLFVHPYVTPGKRESER